MKVFGVVTYSLIKFGSHGCKYTNDVFWDVTASSVVVGDTECLRFTTQKINAASSFETSISVHYTTYPRNVGTRLLHCMTTHPDRQ
jgi:hypothetical protein